MQIDMASLSSTVAAALRRCMAEGWTSLTPSPSSSFQDAMAEIAPGASSTDAATAPQSGSGLLASTTAQYLMQLNQEMTVPASTNNISKAAGVSNSTSSTDTACGAIGTMNIMEEVADDPVEADSMARRMMAGNQLIARKNDGDLFRGPLVQMSGPGGLWMPASTVADEAIVNGIAPQLQALYQQDKAEGKSGAQTVADMLELELGQSQNYWNARDPDKIEGDARAIAQTQLDILNQAMTQKEGMSGKSANAGEAF